MKSYEIYIKKTPIEENQAEFNKKYGYKDKPKPKAKVKKHFANYVVYVSLTAILMYTAVGFILQFAMGIEPSPTLTTCFYSFFGVELASLALIKHTKTKYLNRKEMSDNEQ